MDFVEACLDEIALEGLDGITLSAFWIRLSVRKPPLSLALDDFTKEYLWSAVLLGNENVEFYELLKPRPPLVLYDRFKHTDPETGVIVHMDDHPEDIYPICIIKDDPDGIMGSCLDFHTRRNVTAIVRKAKMNLNSVLQKWGEKFVIVASQHLRAMALFGCRQIDPDVLKSITDVKYAVLERIGRSRYHGEVTQSQDGLKVFHLQPKSMFYIRKILRNVGLITVQPISIRSPKSVSVNGKLTHLMRFFTEFRPKYAVWLEDLTSRLAAKPCQRELLAHIRSEMGLREKTFRKLLNLGKNHVHNEMVKFKEFFPEAITIDSSKKSKNLDRVVRTLKLIKPYNVSQNFDDDDDDESEKFGRGKDDENEKDFEDLDMMVAVGKDFSSKGSSTSLLYERPVLHQVLGCIEMLGGRGQSLVDLATRYGITKLDSRTICRNLSRKGCTITVMQDEGKNRVSRFVSKRAISNASAAAQRPTDDVSQEVDNVSLITENKDEEEICLKNSVNQTAKGSLVEEYKEVTADEKEKEELLKILEVFPDTTTIRTLRRAKTILTAVEQARVVSDIVLIQKKIRGEEATASMMDRKSFLRLIDKLCSGNKIQRIFNTVELPNGQEKEVVFLCVPSITDDDLLVQSALEAARQKLITVKAESSCIQKLVKDENSVLKSNDADTEESLQYDATACKRYGYLPRMARLRTLHQLLWTLVYGKHGKLSLENTPVVDQGQKTAPAARETTFSLLSDDFYSAPETEEKSDETLNSHYTMMSWHRTLPQLPKHSGYDEGWCCIFDVLQVIPIFVICQIISIPFVIEGLESFLSDCVKCMTPYNKIPIDWKKVISHKRRYITHFYSDCKSLAQLGLLTFGKREFKQKEQGFVYIHKRASLVNTTRSDISRAEFPICSFTFETFQNVEDYWLSLQSLSFNTPRENLLAISKRRVHNADKRFDDCLTEREVGNVVDKGVLPGDGMGGAGTDSTFFSHLRRNWSRNTDSDVKMELLINDGQYLANERAMTRAMQGKTKKKQQVKLTASSDVQPKSKKSGKAKSNPNVKFTKEVVAGVLPKKGGKGVKRKRNGVVEGLLKKSKRIREKRSQTTDAEKATTAAVERAKRRRRHDTKDAKAIQLLKRHRVTWTPQEDSLLLLCQLTNQFLSGLQKLCLVGNAVIRDIMHENLAVARDKTRLACSRRIKYMMKNSVTVQNVQMYLGEALQDKDLVAEFKDGKKYVITNTAENELVFKRCLAKMREKFRCERESMQDIPDTLAEISEKFSVIRNTSYGKSTHHDVSSVSEIFYSVLHNLIHAAIVLTDKVGRYHELCQLFGQYPESVLVSVFTSMKNDRILTKIKKSMAKKSRGIPLMTMGIYQISQRYMYYWHSNNVLNVFAAVGAAMQQFPPNPDDSTHGSDFLLLRNTATHSIITVTLMSLRLVTFETTIPEQIVVIDSMSKEKKTIEQPRKKRKIDNESDLEEEALIEEAERDKAQEALTEEGRGTSGESVDSTVVDATPSVIMYNKNQSSRTVLSYYRCQYVHSKTVRLLNANDNIFINACDVRIRLKPSELRDVQGSCETTWANDVEAHRRITEWNQSHIMLHPKTCQMILKSIRTIYPDRIRSSLALENCHKRSEDKGLLTSVYEEIKRHEFLGITIYQLRETFSSVNGYNLMDHLAIMIDCKLVVRVGVTVFRYVCLEFASSWLIRINKNLKGRGFLHIDEEEDVKNEVGEVNSTAEAAPSNSDASSSSCAANVYSSPISRSRISQSLTESVSSLQFEPSPKVAATKRQRSEVGDDKNGEDMELVEGDQMQAPPLKCPKLSEENLDVSQDCHQFSDGVEMMDCTETRKESLQPSAKSLQSTEESFLTEMEHSVVAAETVEPSREFVRLLGEASEPCAWSLTASGSTLQFSPNCSESQKVRAADVTRKTEIIQSNLITSDFAKQNSDSEPPHGKDICSPNVSVSVTLANTLPPLPVSAQIEPSVAVITEQQVAFPVVSESNMCPRTISESASQISCVDAPISESAAIHTSKSPAHKAIPFTGNSKSPACKSTPVSSTLKSPACKSTRVITRALKSPVRKSTLVTNVSKSPAQKSTLLTDVSKSPARKHTPVTPPSNSSGSRKGLANLRSPASEKETNKVSVGAEKMLALGAEEISSAVSGGIKARGDKQSNENPSTGEVTDDSYFSSLVNSVPKVLKRPRDFFKNRPSSERRGGITPRTPKSPRPIRLPSWMASEKKTELISGVQKSPSCSTSIDKHEVRRISTSDTEILEVPERRTDSTVSKTAVVAGNTNSSQTFPLHVFPPHKVCNPKSLLSSQRSDSPFVSPVQGSELPMSPYRSKQPVTPALTSHCGKTLPVVRLATSGTCTTITVFSPEKKSSRLDVNTTKAQTSSVFDGSNVAASSLSAFPPLVTINKATASCSGRNSKSPRVAVESVCSSAADSESKNLSQRSANQFGGSKNTNASAVAASSEGISSMSAQRIMVSSSNQFSPRATVGSPQFGVPSAGIDSVPATLPSSPSTPQGQAIRIRVPASSLGSVSGANDLARQIQEMLAKQGSLKPGQQVRLRLPPGVTLQNLGFVNTAPSPGQSLMSPGQPGTAVVSSGQLLAGNNASLTNEGSETSLCKRRNHTSAEQKPSDRQAGNQSSDDKTNFRLPQVDGAVDENSVDSSDSGSLAAGATRDTSLGTTDLGNRLTSHTTEDRSLHSNALASTSDNEQLDELCPKEQLEDTQNVDKIPVPENRMKDGGQRNAFPAPAATGTYRKVRLIPRPWRTPEGTVNRPTLQTMLEAVMLFIIEKPGVTRDALIEKYTPVLQPVAIFELVEMLEEIGCLKRTYLQRSHKPALFSSRSQYRVVTEDYGKEMEVFRPTPGCILKLGQFVTQLTSGLRNPAS